MRERTEAMAGHDGLMTMLVERLETIVAGRKGDTELASFLTDLGRFHHDHQLSRAIEWNGLDSYRAKDLLRQIASRDDQAA